MCPLGVVECDAVVDVCCVVLCCVVSMQVVPNAIIALELLRAMDSLSDLFFYVFVCLCKLAVTFLFSNCHSNFHCHCGLLGCCIIIIIIIIIVIVIVIVMTAFLPACGLLLLYPIAVDIPSTNFC